MHPRSAARQNFVRAIRANEARGVRRAIIEGPVEEIRLWCLRGALGTGGGSGPRI